MAGLPMLPGVTTSASHNAPIDPRVLNLPCGAWRFGVADDWARNVVRARSLTRVPCTPPWLKGATNWEGEIIPVIDLATWLGHPVDDTVSRHWLVGGEDHDRLALCLTGRPHFLNGRPQAADPAALTHLPATLRPLVRGVMPDASPHPCIVLDGPQLFESLLTDLSHFCALPGTA